MRTLPLHRVVAFLIALSGIGIVLSSSSMSRRAFAGRATCTASATASCSTCAGTGNVYSCQPPGLGAGQIYGSCPNGNGTCFYYDGGPDGDRNRTCGNSDYDCANPPAAIPNSNACFYENPSVCAANNPGN